MQYFETVAVIIEESKNICEFSAFRKTLGILESSADNPYFLRQVKILG